jgi:hypothetical protein
VEKVMAFIFPAMIHVASLPVYHGYVYYPQVSGLRPDIQQNINRHIYSQVIALLNKQGYYENPQKADVNGQFAIRTNKQGILSLSLSNYTFIQMHANGIEYLESMTYDIMTGKYYPLKDLFKPNSPYVEKISDIVKPELQKRAGGYIIKPFEQISPDQPYYIADRSLVIVLPVLEYTAHVVGNLYFPISVYALEPWIDDQGPLGKMIRGI